MNITGKLSIESFDSIDIQQMDQDDFPHPWNTHQWSELAPCNHLLFSWRNQNTLIGYCLFGLIPGDDVAHLYKILISSPFQGRGHASEFWSAILQDLKTRKVSRVYLEVNAINIPAIKFYEKCGFRLLRRNQGYYSNGEDGLMMELTL